MTKRLFERLGRRRLVQALLIACGVLLVLLRIFAIQAYDMPSTSMYPALRTKDYFFVAKLALLFGATPGRGEATVFEMPYASPDAKPETYVKRVVAVGGDSVTMEGGHPIVNGWRVPTCPVGRVRAPEQGHDDVESRGRISRRARLPRRRQARARAFGDELGRSGPWVVPPGEFFVLGDNRGNSADSRSWRGGQGGFVPKGNLIGSLWAFWYPLSRIGDPLDEPVLPEDAKALAPALAACLKKAPKPEQTRPPAPSTG